MSQKADAPAPLPMVTDAELPRASKELERLLSILRRALSHWKSASLMILFGVLLGFAVIFLRKPAFRSETTIIYREGIRPTLLGQEGGGVQQTLGLGLREMLFARPGLEKIVTEFGLYPKTLANKGMVEAVDEFRTKIHFQSKAPDTFAIMFEGRTPDEAQQVVARLAENLIAENRRVKVEQTRSQTEFLEVERKRSDDAVKVKEKELAQFLAQHPEFALEPATQQQAGASIRAQEKAKQGETGPDAALTALERQAQRSRALMRARAVGAPLPGVSIDPALESAKNEAENELANAKRDLAEKQAKYTEQHPDVRAAQAKVTAAQQKADRAKKAVTDAQSAALSAQSVTPPEADPEKEKQKIQVQLISLEQEISDRKKKKEQGQKAEDKSETASRVVALETDWARINREVGEARDRSADMERRTFRAQVEASSTVGGLSAQIVVIDPAYKPNSPASLPKSMVLIIAFAASSMLAALVSLLRALLDDRIFEPADLARVAPVLVSIPRPETRRRRG